MHYRIYKSGRLVEFHLGSLTYWLKIRRWPEAPCWEIEVNSNCMVGEDLREKTSVCPESFPSSPHPRGFPKHWVSALYTSTALSEKQHNFAFLAGSGWRFSEIIWEKKARRAVKESCRQPSPHQHPSGLLMRRGGPSSFLQLRGPHFSALTQLRADVGIVWDRVIPPLSGRRSGTVGDTAEIGDERRNKMSCSITHSLPALLLPKWQPLVLSSPGFSHIDSPSQLWSVMASRSC